MAGEEEVGMIAGVVDDPAGGAEEIFGEPEIETPEGEEIPGETPEGEEPPEPEPAETKPTTPSSISKLIREIKESNPQAAPIAKQLQDAYFSDRSWKEVFPSIEEAKVLKASFDSIGGREGLLELQSVSETLSDLDKMLETGDPKLVEDILSKSPEGFSKIVPHALRTLERSDPQTYASILRPLVAGGVINSDVGHYIAGAIDSLKSGDPDMALRRLGPALQWFKALEQEAQRGPELAASPAGGFEDKEKGLQEREYKMNSGYVQRDMNSYALSGARNSLRPMLKTANLNAEAKSDLEDGVLREIGNALMSDKVFQEQIDSLVKRGNLDKALSLAKVHIDRVRPEAVKSVYQRRYGSLAPLKPTNGTPRRPVPASTQGQARSATPGIVQMPKMPPMDAIDMRRTDAMMVADHKAILKDGRTVSWPR